jgi:hypothetical protein
VCLLSGDLIIFFGKGFFFLFLFLYIPNTDICVCVCVPLDEVVKSWIHKRKKLEIYIFFNLTNNLTITDLYFSGWWTLYRCKM